MTSPAQSRTAMLAFALALASGFAWAAPGRVGGQVVDPDGRPLEGVEVGSGAARAVTDAGGLYVLDGVRTGSRVVVSFSKPGYATTYGTVEIPDAGDTDGDGVPDASDRCPVSDQRPSVTIDGCDTGLGNRLVGGCTAMDVFLDCSAHACRAWHLLGCIAEPRFLRRVDGLTWETLKRSIACARNATLPLAEAEEQSSLPRPSATLHRTLLPAEGATVVDAASGGTVERSGFAVTFPPGAIRAEGPVEVALAPLDVATPAIGAFPGDSGAVGHAHEKAPLETWGALQVTLTRAGRPVTLHGTATIEVPLPLDSSLAAGDRVPLWRFRPGTGLWKEKPAALAEVRPSSRLPGRLAAVGPVRRTGWWSVARTVDAACFCGRVEDARASLVAGALVTATGLDHHAVTAAWSGHDGSYCAEVRSGSRVSVQASALVGGVRLDSAPVEAAATGAAANGACGCEAGPALVVPETSCVCGRTLDELGQPRPGVKVATSAGSAAASDADGRFCLAAPAGQRATVFGEGYPPATVETNEGPATCPNGCAVVDLVPVTSPERTCVSGTVDPNLLPTAVAAIDAVTRESYGRVEPDASGSYTIGGLPVGRQIEVVLEACGTFAPILTTPPAPGGACQEVPLLYCPS